MSEENKVETQTQGDQNTVTNDSTQADKNVPYDRFQEVVQSKNDMAGQLGKLQAQIDKMNSDNKSKQEAKLVDEGIEVNAFVSVPAQCRRTRAKQYLVVRGRPIFSAAP